MIRKTALRFAAACMVCSTAAASPVVTATRISQGSKQMLLIDYTLDSPAVVTFDVLTNGVSIGRDLLETFTGDFGLVEAGARRISWDTRTHWPDQKVDAMTAKVTAWSLDAPPDYMVVDLVHSNVNWYASEADIPGGTVRRDEYKTTKLALRRIHARGIPWRMGRKSTESTDYSSHEKPHEVVLTNDYYMGVFELTQKQYKLIMGLADSATGPFRYKGHDKNPAEKVAYAGLRGPVPNYEFVSKGHSVKSDSMFGMLRKIGGGLCFDLPTSAQWEYACRAGTGTAFNNGLDTICSDVAWYSDNWRDDSAITSNMTHEVGLKTPNAWGLYDMHGNVWEWCIDQASTADMWYQAIEEPIGPEATAESASMYRSGGSFEHGLKYARSASRIGQGSANPDYRIGLRVWCACPFVKE